MSCAALKLETITLTHFDETSFADVERQITAGEAVVFDGGSQAAPSAVPAAR